MKTLVLVSHGHFAEGIKQSAEMIMGEQENIHTVILEPEEGPEDFQKKFLETTESMDEMVVFADLMGVTPCNVVSKLVLAGKNIELYAGMNLPMIISFINGELVGTDEDYVASSQENIANVNEKLQAMMNDDDDE